MALRVFVAGGTGWAGSELCKGIARTKGMELAGALSRKHSGKNLADVLGLESGLMPVYADIETALTKTDFDVLVEYTKPDIAKTNIMAALKRGKNVVVGTSGLTEKDYSEIETMALANQSSVLAVGNFAITVVLLQKFSEIAAKFIPNFEIIDYAHEKKLTHQAGQPEELAHRLSKVQESKVYVSAKDLVGPVESRGVRLEGVQVHSIRLPGHIISIESIFGLKDEKLTLRHDAGSSAEPYVNGGLLAIEKVGTFKGLKRGLDSVMDF